MKKDGQSETLGMHLKKLRTQNQNPLTQEQLAEILGISAKAYGKYEQDTVLIPLEYVIRLADIYGTSTDVVLNRKKPEPSERITFCLAKLPGNMQQRIANAIEAFCADLDNAD